MKQSDKLCTDSSVTPEDVDVNIRLGPKHNVSSSQSGARTIVHVHFKQVTQHMQMRNCPTALDMFQRQAFMLKMLLILIPIVRY